MGVEIKLIKKFLKSQEEQGKTERMRNSRWNGKVKAEIGGSPGDAAGIHCNL